MARFPLWRELFVVRLLYGRERSCISLAIYCLLWGVGVVGKDLFGGEPQGRRALYGSIQYGQLGRIMRFCEEGEGQSLFLKLFLLECR